MDKKRLYSSLLKFANNFTSKNIKKPEFKFICEMLIVMLTSNTLVVTNIARAISDVSDFNSTYRRLDRNLNYYSVADMQNNCAIKNISKLDKNDIIAIDMGDIIKQHAKKMEHIDWVADGSDDHKIKQGYWLLSAVSVNPMSQDKVPLPLYLEL